MSSELAKGLQEAQVQLEIQKQANETLTLLLTNLKSEFSLYKQNEDHKEQDNEIRFFEKLLPNHVGQIPNLKKSILEARNNEIPFFEKLLPNVGQIRNLKKSILEARMTISKQVNEISHLKKEIILLQDIAQQLVTCMNQVAEDLVAKAANKNVPVHNGVPKYLQDLNGEQLRALANEKSAFLCKAKVDMLEAVQENVANISNDLLHLQATAKIEKRKYEQQICDYETSQKDQTKILQELEKGIALFQSVKNSENEKKLEEQVQILRKLHTSVRGNKTIYKLADVVGFTTNSMLNIVPYQRRSKKDKWKELEVEISQQAGILKYLQSLVAEAQNYCEIQTKSSQCLKVALKKDDAIKKRQEHSRDLKLYQETLTKAQQKLADEPGEKHLVLKETERDGQKEIAEQLGGQPEKIKLLETQLKEERDLRLIADGKLFLLEDSFKSLKYFCENELKHSSKRVKYFAQSQNDKSKTISSATSSDEKEQLKSIGQANKALELELDIKTNEIILLKQNLKQMENQMYRTAFDSRFKEERNSMAKLHQEFMTTLNEFNETS